MIVLMTFQVDSPGTVLIITLLDILALDILGLDILGLDILGWDVSFKIYIYIYHTIINMKLSQSV